MSSVIAAGGDAAGQHLGQAEPAFRRAQQHQAAVRRHRPAGEIGSHLFATYGWKIEREKSILGHGGVALPLLRGKSARKRISTRIQRVTPRPPLHPRAAINTEG